MRLKFIVFFVLGITIISLADGSSVSVTPRNLNASTDGSRVSVTPRRLSASTDGISGSITRDAMIARIRPASHGSKVTVNKNKNLDIVNKSKIEDSTVGMSIHAK